MTREAVVRQFFLDFIENLGTEHEDEDITPYVEEEASLVLTDLFFSGLLKLEWNAKKHTLRLNFAENNDKQETLNNEHAHSLMH